MVNKVSGNIWLKAVVVLLAVIALLLVYSQISLSQHRQCAENATEDHLLVVVMQTRWSPLSGCEYYMKSNTRVGQYEWEPQSIFDTYADPI